MTSEVTRISHSPLCVPLCNYFWSLLPNQYVWIFVCFFSTLFSAFLCRCFRSSAKFPALPEILRSSGFLTVFYRAQNRTNGQCQMGTMRDTGRRSGCTGYGHAPGRGHVFLSSPLLTQPSASALQSWCSWVSSHLDCKIVRCFTCRHCRWPKMRVPLNAEMPPSVTVMSDLESPSIPKMGPILSDLLCTLGSQGQHLCRIFCMVWLRSVIETSQHPWDMFL